MADADGLDLDGGHWTFALKVYGTPGVSDACLYLQERFGLDVNVLLIALFQASRGGRLDVVDIAKLDRVAEPLREAVVRPLRAIRAAIKADSALLSVMASVRRKIAATEIEAEKVEQAVLVRALPEISVPLHASFEGVSRDVVAFYAGQALEADGEVDAAISVIAAAAQDGRGVS